MIGSLMEFLLEALSGYSDSLTQWFDARTPLPGDFFRTRDRLEVRAHVRGRARESFRVAIASATTVRVADEHLTPSGEILVTVQDERHVAQLPAGSQAAARANGYLLAIPPKVLRKGFRSVTATPS